MEVLTQRTRFSNNSEKRRFQGIRIEAKDLDPNQPSSFIDFARAYKREYGEVEARFMISSLNGKGQNYLEFLVTELKYHYNRMPEVRELREKGIVHVSREAEIKLALKKFTVNFIHEKMEKEKANLVKSAKDAMAFGRS